MVRLGAARAPALPTTERQRSRRDGMLRAAARLGARKRLEDVQMSEVARDAGVALGTLYRYFPSKQHLYAGVLAAQVAAVGDRSSPAASDAVSAVADLVSGACRAMLAQPLLGRALITATNAVRAESGAMGDTTFRDAILSRAGRAEPAPGDVRLARLVEQATYGVLTWAVAGELSADEATADARLACELLLTPSWGRAGVEELAR